VSGPIVRKYGFPNFDRIFGKKELEHGVEENENEAEKPTENPAPVEKRGGEPASKKDAK
jgi:hypothetical protein